MNALSLLSLLVLLGPAGSDGLLRDPNGLMGFSWGMNPTEAQNTAVFALSCPSGKAPNIECTATLPNPTGQVLGREVQSKASLFFHQNKLVKVWIFKGDAAPGSTILQLHNLLGAPSHSLTLPDSFERVLLFSWVKPKTVLNLEIGPLVEKVASVSITAYAASYYSTLNSVP